MYSIIGLRGHAARDIREWTVGAGRVAQALVSVRPLTISHSHDGSMATICIIGGPAASQSRLTTQCWGDSAARADWVA